MRPPFAVLIAFAAVAVVPLVACSSTSKDIATQRSTRVTADVSVPPSTGGETTTPATTAPLSDLSSLAGTHWVVESRITVGGAIPVASSTDVGFTVDAQGALAISTGCNTGAGLVVPTGESTFVVRNLNTTDIACQGEGQWVEDELLTVLGAEVSWQINSGTLTIIPLTITDVGLILHPAA